MEMGRFVAAAILINRTLKTGELRRSGNVIIAFNSGARTMARLSH
jgi:hypothetical protein